MECYLDRCLTSLITKDRELMKKIEVLIIIDGSKDRSSEIAQTYQVKYPDTFVVINKENGNYGSCINRGLKEASGKYIKVLDADDFFVTSNFELFIKYLLVHDSDLILSDFVRVNEKLKILSKWRLKSRTEECTVDDIDCFDYHMHSITYRTQMLLNLKYVQTEGISYTDTEWIFYPMEAVNSISYFPHTVYCYLVGREGQTVDEITVAKRIDQMLSILGKMLDYSYNNNNLSLQKKKFFVNVNRRVLDFVYYIILVSSKLSVNANVLIDFDKKLHSRYPEYYIIVGSKTLDDIDKHLYVQYWRESNYTIVDNDAIAKYEKRKNRGQLIKRIRQEIKKWVLNREKIN